MARIHRWLGLGIGLMLPVWFLTGAVISFEPFPALAVDERLAGGEPLFAAGRAPGTALHSVCLRAPELAGASRLRLVVVDGGLRWIGRDAAGEVACDADTGLLSAPLPGAAAARIAARFSHAAVRRVEGPLEYDAWTVHDGYLAARPYWRVVLDDQDGTQLYVSRRTGEVAQRTTARQRAWNQVGARLHWLNVGTLRASPTAWHATMRTVASLALALVMLGLGIGLRRAWQARRWPRLRGSPFRGLLRVHHFVGLAGAWVVLLWLGSGWLSLDQGELFGSAAPSASRVAAMQGLSPAQAALDLASAAGPRASPSTAAAAAAIGDSAAGPGFGAAREAEALAFSGRARLVLRDGGALPRVLQRDARGALREAPAFTDAVLRDAVQSAWAPARVVRLEAIDADDGWARRDQPFPPGTRRLRLDDPAATWVQVDARSGALVSVLDAGRRRYRWWVDGLHRLDFPALNRAGAWHALLLAGMAAGFCFSLTGILLGLRRLSGAPRRTASPAGSGASGTAS